MVLEGCTEYQFEDGRVESLAGGQFLAIAPGVQHRGKHDVRRPARLLGLLFNPSAKNATRNASFSSSELRWLTEQIRSGAKHKHQMNTLMRSSIKAVAKLFEKFNPEATEKVISMRLSICAMLLDVAQHCTATGTIEPQQVIQTAIQYMKTHLRSELSIASVAKAVGCSRARLFELFKESTGMTPNDYWLRLRIDQAQELLRTTESSVTKIAMDSGFSSSQYFSTVFKKYAGTNPSAYREACWTNGDLGHSHFRQK